MQKYGRFGKLRFYEIDHKSRTRLLKTHSHTSNGLVMEPETRKENQWKETQTIQQANVTRQNPAACRRCGGGRQKRL